MAAGGRAYFPYISIYKTLKIFFSETNGPISIQLGRNVSLVTLYKDCSSRHDSSKNIAARGRGLFSLYIYIENFKNLLVRNSWTEFNVTWQECCFGDLLPRLFKPSWYVKNHGPQRGRGLFFVYICIVNFKILIVTYPMTDFNITWLECCFGEPLSRLYKQSWFVKKHGCHGVGLIFSIYLNRKL